MTEDQIKHMVNRFLGWRLPEPWHPDGGVTFEPIGNKGHVSAEYRREPTGTNLFDAVQVEVMIRYMVDGMPSAHTGSRPTIADLESLLNSETRDLVEVMPDGTVRATEPQLPRLRFVY